ncbi:MAG: CFI-box-CTERM domain-containing protein [Bdellovibrio sp.]|jgi:hypothetical protein
MSTEVPCPRCGTPTSALQNIDPALLAKLSESGQGGIPGEVCANCFAQLAGSVARGSVLLAREKAREQRKLVLWKSRVGLIKKARSLMSEKAFSEAAVGYEKYIRVLEVVFDAKPGELAPEHFKESARTQELTVVASVYWDLLRIYDTSERYGDRMQAAAQKLAQFLRFTPIYPDIMRKAGTFSKSCKNKPVLKSFLKAASEKKGGCFVATSAFENSAAPEVLILRNWRDESLRNSILGQAFIWFYYRISPPIAWFLDKNPRLKPVVRKSLRLLIDRALRH